MANVYFTSLYYKGLINAQNNTEENEIYHDPHILSDGWNTRVPRQSIRQKWTHIRSDSYKHRSGNTGADPFVLHMDEIRDLMGTTDGIQVRIEAKMTEYFYNDTQHAFAETRIMKKMMTLKFLGPQPMVFKPGMPFEGQLSVLFNDLMPVDVEVLYESKLTLEFSDQNGIFDILTIDPGLDTIDDQDEDPFESFSRAHVASRFRASGIARFNVDVPPDSENIGIIAKIETSTFGQAQTSARAYRTMATNNNFIHVRCSTKNITIGQYAVFHVKTNFPLTHFDWLILSNNLVIKSGREFGNGIHAEVKTFSVVTSPNMAPGFHIVVHASNKNNQVLADSAYYPVITLNNHDVEVKTVQVKDHTMSSVEFTCRGDPGKLLL